MPAIKVLVIKMCASNDDLMGEREKDTHTHGVVWCYFALLSYSSHIATTAVTLVRTARTFNQLKIVIIPRDSHRSVAQKKKSTKPFSTQINP